MTAAFSHLTLRFQLPKDFRETKKFPELRAVIHLDVLRNRADSEQSLRGCQIGKSKLKHTSLLSATSVSQCQGGISGPAL